MSKQAAKKYWKICAWDSTDLLFEKRVGFGQITERSMEKIPQALVAKLALSEDEIIACYARKNTNIYKDHLKVDHLRGKKNIFSCGHNPYVTAELEYGL